MLAGLLAGVLAGRGEIREGIMARAEGILAGG
jgi:hypothetical protein